MYVCAYVYIYIYSVCVYMYILNNYYGSDKYRHNRPIRGVILGDVALLEYM